MQTTRVDLGVPKSVLDDIITIPYNDIEATRRILEDHADDLIDESPSPEDRLIKEQNLANLLVQIKKLKPHYQEVINLRYFQEKSYKEIAKEQDEPINNVKVKLLRAKKLLAEIIKNSRDFNH